MWRRQCIRLYPSQELHDRPGAGAAQSLCLQPQDTLSRPDVQQARDKLIAPLRAYRCGGKAQVGALGKEDELSQVGQLLAPCTVHSGHVSKVLRMTATDHTAG